MSRWPGHRKFNVTREVISKGTDGKEHFCNGGVQEGRADNRRRSAIDWLSRNDGMVEGVGEAGEEGGGVGFGGGTCRPLARSSVLSRLLHVCPAAPAK